MSGPVPTRVNALPVTQPIPAGAQRVAQRWPQPPQTLSHAVTEPLTDTQENGAAHSFGRIDVQPKLPLQIQFRLTVGQPNDPYEEEANRAANAVVGSAWQAQRPQLAPESAPPLRRQAEPEEDEETREEEEEEAIQTHPLPGQTPQVTPGLARQIEHAAAERQPLPPTARTMYEERFGHDFGNVRIHSGPQAATAAHALRAQAFTHGQDIYFGAGSYQPDTTAGRWLIAHELAHTLQQRPMVIARRAESALTPIATDDTTADVAGEGNQTDAAVTEMIDAMRADPTDRSRRLRDRLASMDVVQRRTVLTQVRGQLSPARRILLDTLLAESSEPQSAASPSTPDGRGGSMVARRRAPAGTVIPELPVPVIPSQPTPATPPTPPTAPAQSAATVAQQQTQSAARSAEGSAQRVARTAAVAQEVTGEAESGNTEAATQAEQAEGEADALGGEGEGEGLPRLADLLESVPEESSAPGAGMESPVAEAAPAPVAPPSFFAPTVALDEPAPAEDDVEAIDGGAGAAAPNLAIGEPGAALAEPATGEPAPLLPEETAEPAPVEGTEAPVDVQSLIAELTAAPGEAQAQLQGEADSVRASIRQRSSGLIATVRSQVSRTVGQVRQEFTTKRSALQSAIVAARTQIDTGLTGRQGELETQSSGGRERIQGVFDDHRTTIEQTVSDNIANTEQLRTRYATLAHDRTAEKARTARQRGQARAGSYPNTGRGQVQADAASGVAERTAREIEEKEPETVQAIEEVVAEIPAKFEEEGQKTLQGYDEPLPGLLTEVDNQISAAREQLEQTANDARGQLENIASELTSQLDTAETAAIGRIEALGPRAETQINSAMRAALRQVDRAVPEAVAKITPVAEEATQILSGAETLDRDRARAFTDAVLTFIRGAGEEGSAALREAGEAITEQLQQADQSTRSSLRSAQRQATTELNASEQQSNGRLTRFIERADQEFGTPLTTFDTGITNTENHIREQFQPAVRDLQTQFQDTLRDADARSGQALDEGMVKNDEALGELDDKMSEAASDAAWDYDHDWLAALRDIGLIVAGVIVGILAVIALVIVVIVAAKLLVAGLVAAGVAAATAALVAKIVLITVAVVGIGMTAYAAYQGYSARRAQGAGFWEALGGGVSDVVGITDMRRAFSEEGLSPFDRGFFFGRGAATFVATLLGARRMVTRFRGRMPATVPNPRALPRTPALRTLTRLYNNPAAAGRLLRMRLRGIRPGAGSQTPPPPPPAPPPVPALPPGPQPRGLLPPGSTPPRALPPGPTPPLALPPGPQPRGLLPPGPTPPRALPPGPTPPLALPPGPPVPRALPAGPVTPRTSTPPPPPAPTAAGPSRPRLVSSQPASAVRPSPGAARPQLRVIQGGRAGPTPPRTQPQVQPRPQVQELPLAASGEGRVIAGGTAARPQLGVIQGGARQSVVGGRSPLDVRAVGGRGPRAGGGTGRGPTSGTTRAASGAGSTGVARGGGRSPGATGGRGGSRTTNQASVRGSRSGSRTASQAGGRSTRGPTPQQQPRPQTPRQPSTNELRNALQQPKPPRGSPFGDLWRYARYRLTHGGQRNMADWLRISRGGRRGGVNHQAIQNRLTSGQGSPRGARSEVQVGDRFADAYWPRGPNGRPVYHQIGGLNRRGDPIFREREAIEALRRVLGRNVEIWFWDKFNPNATRPAQINPDLQSSWFSTTP